MTTKLLTTDDIDRLCMRAIKRDMNDADYDAIQRLLPMTIVSAVSVPLRIVARHDTTDDDMPHYICSVDLGVPSGDIEITAIRDAMDRSMPDYMRNAIRDVVDDTRAYNGTSFTGGVTKTDDDDDINNNSNS
jgi:hypothetical protein